MASKNPRNISRINNDKTKGWFVRLRRDGEAYSKLFSDKKYGGKSAAKKEAISHRDMLLAEKGEKASGKVADSAPKRRGRPPKNAAANTAAAKKTVKAASTAKTGRRRGRPRQNGEDSEAMRGISRIDSANTHGWFVRIYRNKKTHSKLFSDKKYGGQKTALQDASNYRDQLLKDLESGKTPKPAARRGRPPKAGVKAKSSKRTATAKTKAVAKVTNSLERRLVSSRGVYKVTFFLPAAGAPGAKTVHLVGDFNGWDQKANRMKKARDGSFSLKLEVPAGRDYQFRYLIDGQQWENDWQADRYEYNGIDGNNSVLALS